MGRVFTDSSAPVGALNMKTTLFCRVSSKEQEIEGYSLPAQRSLLTEYADKRGFEVKKTFSISESASGNSQRKTFKEMLTYLSKNNIKVLIVEKTDRLTRNHKDAVAINEWVEKDPERQVHFVKENFILRRDSKSNEKFIWNIKVSVAEYYLDNLSEEVKKGQKEKLHQGWLPTKPPLGYKTVGEKGKRIHIIDDSAKRYVEKMFKLYDSGEYSVKRLANVLYKDGLRSTGGKKVPHSRIHTYLKDLFYIGMNVWNNKEYPGKQETFIPHQLFDRVQKRLESKATPRYKKHNWLFKGLIKCKECSGTITWEIQKGIIYGHCNHYKDCKQKAWSKEKEVEEQLVDVFDGFQIKNKRLLEWIRKALKESHQDEVEYYTNAISELNKRSAKLKARMSKLYDDKLDGTIDENFYETKFSEYSKEREKIETQIAQFGKSDIKYYEVGTAIYDLSQKSRDVYLKAPLDKKRKLLRLVFSEMRLDEETLSYEFTEPFRLLSEAVFATNSSKLMKKALSEGKTFEPEEYVAVEAIKGGSDDDNSNWLPRLDSNQQPLA